MIRTPFGAEVCIPIREDADVSIARQKTRAVARQAGLHEAAIEQLATATSEVSRNILVHAGEGEVLLRLLKENGRQIVEVIARDNGPGISDIELAMQDGYSITKGLGLGLSSARRLVDEFELASEAEKGTTVILRKWSS